MEPLADRYRARSWTISGGAGSSGRTAGFQPAHYRDRLLAQLLDAGAAIELGRQFGGMALRDFRADLLEIHAVVFRHENIG